MPIKQFGFVPLNKPSGISSRSAVDVVKKLVKPAKVGHTGTLDPLATGVLVICVGPATRLATFVQQSRKTYIGTFKLGVSSETDDVESELKPVEHDTVLNRQQLEEILPEFTGAILQTPPIHSAIKVNGRRAYDLARSGKRVQLEPREVQVYRAELLEFDYPKFKMEIECGAGTYIRSIGRDIGNRLGSAAVMTDLTRTRVGNFSLSDCFSRFLFGMPVMVLPGGNDTPLQFVHERDVAAAILKIIESSANGAFNIGPGDSSSLSTIARKSGRRAIKLPYWFCHAIHWLAWNCRFPIHESPPSLLEFARYPWLIDSSRLTEELGFQFQYSSDQTLDIMIDHLS